MMTTMEADRLGELILRNRRTVRAVEQATFGGGDVTAAMQADYDALALLVRTLTRYTTPAQLSLDDAPRLRVVEDIAGSL